MSQLPVWVVERCSTLEILPLRMSVLRDGTPSQDPRYELDDLNGTVHFGVRENGEIIATSTWHPLPWPRDPTVPAVQLRGMAVAKRHQGHGLGGVVLAAGIDYARALGAQYVWARARDSALYFYEHHGFTVVGDGFVDEATGFGHHFVVQSLARNEV
ncbi:MAG: GNAT family N-acetyltransferase [Actinomycetota bacterium]